MKNTQIKVKKHVKTLKLKKLLINNEKTYNLFIN